MNPENKPQAQEITDAFGIYRAEWLSDALFRLFTKPAYYPELETPRPCFLVGGRGTGKTTVLRCLSYEGKFHLSHKDPSEIDRWPYYAFYYRVNTNRVTAFRGGDLTADQWTKIFAHYLNLLFCGQVLKFMNWYAEQRPGTATIAPSLCAELAENLYLDRAHDQATLSDALERGRRKFEAFLNNITPDRIPDLSLQGQPIDDLCDAVLSLPQFNGKYLCFIVDEFENLEDYQQEILNTLIKHCGPAYTFKIGVRHLGRRRRSTLNPNEQLVSPADYQRIDIEQRLEGDLFTKFAEEVCSLRAQDSSDFPSGLDLRRILPSLSVADEAELLGVADRAAQIREHIKDVCPEWLAVAREMSNLEVYFADYWAKSQASGIQESLESRQRSPKNWEVRFKNYSYPLLFTLRTGRVGVRKFYCGWRTYTLMAGNNIRYLLELVGQALVLQRQAGLPSAEPISPELQTEAAVLVGRKNLSELEGLSVLGAQLTKLLLGLGRVFGVLASEPSGHTPEITQFHIPDNAILGDAEALLNAGVMHLALVRSVSNKLSGLDIKAYDYAVHPIYAAFFVFSHRRKRKMKLSPTQIVGIVTEPKLVIGQILRQHNRIEDFPLPEQLRLFEGYYGISE